MDYTKCLHPSAVQLIYDFQDGGGSFGLMTLHPDQIPEQDKERFRKIGIRIPSMLLVILYKLLKIGGYKCAHSNCTWT